LVNAVTGVASDYQVAASSLLEAVLSGEETVANREQLGPMVPIRLFQALRLIAFGSTMEQMIGGGARALVYQSGQQLGHVLGSAVVGQANRDLKTYVGIIQKLCKKLSIGFVVVEKVALSDGLLVLRVDECVSCAGISGTAAPICHFEAGMVGGIVRVFLNTDVRASEVKCNAVGDRTCAIEVRVPT
jgi:predicted hydrocarbon binding protein